ncbi:GNAT family N-acetyltransferase [Ideonella sp.]|uniref:GNAT family N-acetyltransferase n=1 Tax=Ideonella sp. TaxID=1929293 RepID=UPI0035B2810B
MAASVVVRRAVAADAVAIEALYRQLVANPAVQVLPERVAELAAESATRLLVADHQGQVCGTLLLSLCADVMFGRQPFAVIENIVVDAAHRGSGIGSRLLRHAESLCVDAGCSKIMLTSAAGRAEAHRFFEQQGFDGAAKRGFVKYRRQFAAL